MNDFISGYKNFSVKRTGSLAGPWPNLGTRFEVNQDLSPLFPFINADIPDAQYFASPRRIHFLFAEVRCTLYPREVIAAAFTDQDSALRFSQLLVAYLNDLYERRSVIKPDYRTTEPVPPLAVYRLLPQTNCGVCGYASCLAFAAAVSKEQASTAGCPGFSEPITRKAVYPVFDKAGNVSATIGLSSCDRQGKSSAPESKLTKRELQVLRLLAGGASGSEISEMLFISPHTVKSHITHIYEKLGVNDRAQAAVWATRHQVV